MNKLNVLIKQMMLSYPSLYPSRWEALIAIYCRSTSFDWNKAGEIVHIHDDVWDMSKPVTLENFLSTAGTDLERIQLTLCFNNIDVFVEASDAHTSPEGIIRVNASVLALCESTLGLTQYATILNIPTNAEESFLAGAIEVADRLSIALSVKVASLRFGVLVQKQIKAVLEKHSYTHSPQFADDLKKIIASMK